MKQFFTLLISLLFVTYLFAQTRTTIANGNWTVPTTWDCMCVPTPGSTVVINHTVTLTSDWGQPSGSITINASGSLIQDATPRAFGQSGGSFSNAGFVRISKMAFSGGNLINSGVIESVDSLYLATSIANDGSITSNNLFNSSVLTNNNTINGINFFNNSTFQNSTSGSIQFENHFNNSITTNDGFMTFSYYTNAGKIYNNLTGSISVNNNCTNGDTINHDAHWYNNGATTIGNSFTNIDTLDALISNNKFCVYNNSANLGKVIGLVNFCDISSMTFDLNSGIISASVIFCQSDCFVSVSENKIALNINIFPNPVKESLTINLNNNLVENIQILDILGKVVYSEKVNSNNEIIILRNNIPAGLYVLKANTADKSFTSKVLLE